MSIEFSLMSLSLYHIFIARKNIMNRCSILIETLYFEPKSHRVKHFSCILLQGFSNKPTNQFVYLISNIFIKLKTFFPSFCSTKKALGVFPFHKDRKHFMFYFLILFFFSRWETNDRLPFSLVVFSVFLRTTYFVSLRKQNLFFIFFLKIFFLL